MWIIRMRSDQNRSSNKHKSPSTFELGIFRAWIVIPFAVERVVDIEAINVAYSSFTLPIS